MNIHPALSADYNTGIYETRLYGYIDSSIYPTLDNQNDTFNRAVGVMQKYSPLPDLVFSAQGDYAHYTYAGVLVNSLPTPLPAGSPPPPGTAGILATQQFVVNPNDVYTAQATMYKEFNRAFIKLNGSIATTLFEQQPSLNYQQSTYDGTGGFWLTPQLYGFGDGIQSISDPAVGFTLNTFRARGGLGTSQIGLFQSYIYYGQQGAETNGAGSAGGDLYGGAVSYFPTSVWNMSFSVDRLRNVSNISPDAQLPIASALAGLPYSPAYFSVTQSMQFTDFVLKSNYTISPQTALYAVGSYTIGNQIAGAPPSQIKAWYAEVGITQQVWDDLSVRLDYQFSNYVSTTAPLTSWTRNLISLGALYRF